MVARSASRRTPTRRVVHAVRTAARLRPALSAVVDALHTAAGSLGRRWHPGPNRSYGGRIGQPGQVDSASDCCAGRSSECARSARWPYQVASGTTLAPWTRTLISTVMTMISPTRSFSGGLSSM